MSERLGTVLIMGMMALTGCAKQQATVQTQAQAQQPAQQPTQPEMKAAPATPIAEKKAELGGDTWDPAWDKVVEQALPAEMLSNRVERDVRPFCPRFGQMAEADKRAYWAYFFQALAGAEAGLKPTTDVRHTEAEVAKTDTVTKRSVRSQGLLQLTYEDSDRYGCDFDWEKDKQLKEHDPAKTILQPDKNLQCGVKILNNQMIAQGKPMLSRASYWSTLQPGTASYRMFVKQMKNVPEACRARAGAPVERAGDGRKRGAGAGSEAAEARPGPGKTTGTAAMPK
jgi:hypothetical protein